MKSNVNWSIKQEVVDGKPENHLICHNPWLNVWWSVPGDFDMPDKALLSLVEYLLLGRFVNEFKNDNEIGYRYPGKGIALAYSGGLDSTAAFELLPYTNTFNIQYYKDKLTDKMKSVLPLMPCPTVVKTNMHDFGKVFGKKSIGLWSWGLYDVPALLYADYYDIGVSCTGQVLDMIYFNNGHYHGEKYNEYGWRNKVKFGELFERVGVRQCLPTAGLTAVPNYQIIRRSNSVLTPYIHSCTKKSGLSCNQCYKCFLRHALYDNTVIDITDSIKSQFTQGRTTADLYHLYKYDGWPCEMSNPDTAKPPKSVNWVGKWYTHSSRFIPDYLISYFLLKLDEYGIKHVDDDSGILNWVGINNL